MSLADQKETSKVFFPNLDGLRSVAFLMVFLNHTFLPTFKQLPIDGTFYERVLTTLTSGGTGVSVFFVLSGFLITYLLLDEKERQGKINVKFFYIRRILRIWPLYYLVIIFAVSIFPYIKSHLGQKLDFGLSPFYYYTFLSNFDAIRIIKRFGVIPQMMSGITWSVSIEEQFYVIWPLLFTIIPQKFYQYIFLTIILICLIFRFFFRNDGVVLYYNSLSVCADLAIGGLAAYYSYTNSAFTIFLNKLSGRTIITIYLIGFLWLLFGDQHFISKTFTPVNRFLSILFFAFIVLEQNYSNNSFYKFSKSSMLSFWGKYTYGLYMLHGVGLWITTITISKLFRIPDPDIFLPSIFRNVFAFFLTLALAYISYEYYEKRFLKLKDKFSFTGKEKSFIVQQPMNEMRRNDA